MSFHDTLLASGYQERDLADLTQNQLALLVQEEHIENSLGREARTEIVSTLGEQYDGVMKRMKRRVKTRLADALYQRLANK